ncbi:oligosaccharide flippase family protein [Bacillus sp. B15-48]|uniref:oligosaccharide flippase family protein n=1 Tax=Bacillus sp. B15-48 TaxID=1548601 RepID=UPI00193F1B98|nr:oligosaccharide flippase family protein [Bacillus sp. B15-48]MBM4764471.1 oligosaccharide flippase family protein [Bacillus sp. B15-48]
MAISLNYKNSLRSGGVWAIFGKFSTSFMTLFINAILARMLVAEDLGVYFLAFNIAIFGAYLGTLGFEQTVVRFVADSIGKNELKNVSFIINLSLLVTTIGFAVVGILYYYSSKWISITLFQSVGLSSITILVIAWIGANSFQILLGETFRGFQDIRFASIFGGLLSTVLFITLLCVNAYWMWIPVTLSTTVLFWVVSLVLSNTVGIIILARKVKLLMKEAKPSLKRTVHVQETFSTTLSFMVITISTYFMSQSDLWIISGIGTEKDIAIYGAAAKLAVLMSMPLIIINSVVPPLIAEKYAQGEIKGFERTLRLIATLAFYPTLALFILFLFWGEFILSFIFGSSLYGSGALILTLLALKYLISAWGGATSTVLAMAGRQKQLMKVTFLTGFASIVLAIILGNLYGGFGVALGFLITSMISQIYLIFSTSKLLNIRAYVDVFKTSHLLKETFKQNRLKRTS